jgi:hypothetical protein
MFMILRRYGEVVVCLSCQHWAFPTLFIPVYYLLGNSLWDVLAKAEKKGVMYNCVHDALVGLVGLEQTCYCSQY